MAPLRTARESFDLKQLSSGLDRELRSFRSFPMNDLMARLADNQRLTAACSHSFDPERFIAPAWLVQICQFADVVNLAVPLRPAQLAFVSQKALHHLAPNAEYFLGLIVEDGAFLPTQFDAPKPCYQWLLVLTAFDDDLQHLLAAMTCGHGGLVLPADLTDGRSKLVRQRLDQRKTHDPAESPQAVDVESQQVVLHEAPIFRLVLGDDTEVGIMPPSGQVDRLAATLVEGTFLANDLHGDLQSRCAIDAALTAVVMLAIGVQGDDLIAEESCRFRAGMGDQRLVLREFKLESALQELLQMLFDLLGFCPWTTETEQEVIRIPDVPKAAEVRVVGVTGGHALSLSA
jgi:hypothetical protein